MGVQAPTWTPLSNPAYRLRWSRPWDRSPGGHPAERPALGSQRWWAWAPRERGERRGLVPLKLLPARTCAHGHTWRAVHGASAHPVPAAGGALGSRRTRLCSRPALGPHSASRHTSANALLPGVPPRPPAWGASPLGPRLHLRAALHLPWARGPEDHGSQCGHEESLVHKCVLCTSLINTHILFSLFLFFIKSEHEWLWGSVTSDTGPSTVTRRPHSGLRAPCGWAACPSSHPQRPGLHRSSGGLASAEHQVWSPHAPEMPARPAHGGVGGSKPRVSRAAEHGSSLRPGAPTAPHTYSTHTWSRLQR